MAMGEFCEIDWDGEELNSSQLVLLIVFGKMFVYCPIICGCEGQRHVVAVRYSRF